MSTNLGHMQVNLARIEVENGQVYLWISPTDAALMTAEQAIKIGRALVESGEDILAEVTS